MLLVSRVFGGMGWTVCVSVPTREAEAWHQMPVAGWCDHAGSDQCNRANTSSFTSHDSVR